MVWGGLVGRNIAPTKRNKLAARKARKNTKDLKHGG